MAQYDGSIRIDTRVDTKGLQRGLTSVKGDLGKFKDSIHNGMSALDRGITDIGGKIKKMGSGMRREVSSVRGSVDGLTGSFKKLGATIASVFAVRKIAGMASSMTELGSDLEEVQNVVDVTFTTMSDKVDEFAKAAARSAGLSETMAKRYVGTFGAMSKSFGFAEDAAFGMSTTLTQLAGDVASFYNISQDEAYTKLKSVFTGETETLKDLGVVMTENALNSYAMAKGIGKTVSKMTEQQKVALRYQFVLEKLSGASGDFVRTQDSWANQTRVLKLQLESLKATIGQGLINVLNPLLKMLNTLLEKLRAVANAFKSFTESFFGKTSAGSSGAGYVDTSEDIAGSLEDVSDAAKDAEKSLEGYLSPLDEINKYSIVEGMLNGILDSLKSIGAWIKEHIFEPFIDGFKKAFDIHSPSGVMENMGEYIIEGLLNGLKNMWGSITSWIEDKVDWIIDKFRSVKDKVSGFFSGGGSGDSGKSYSSRSYSIRSISTPYVHPSIANLQNIEIPKLATGAVLPANREFLAILGDQKHGTNIEAPLDTIKQAAEEAVLNVFSRIGMSGGNMGGTPVNLTLQVALDGQVIGQKMVDWGKLQQMATGVNPYDFGTT